MMERLTYDFCVGNTHCWQVKGADNFLCKDVCREQGDNGCEECPIKKAFDRLARYEDTGLEPCDYSSMRAAIYQAEELKKQLSDVVNILGCSDIEHLKDIFQTEKDGRLVVLPCKTSDTLYVVGEKQIVCCDIGLVTFLNDGKGPEYVVFYECDSDCEGCPFDSWGQTPSGEWSCGGEFGQSVVYTTDFGKTVFLTREEAAAALKKREGTK